jgi:hypothetical protein
MASGVEEIELSWVELTAGVDSGVNFSSVWPVVTSGPAYAGW